MTDLAALKQRLEAMRASGQVSGEYPVLRLVEALSLVEAVTDARLDEWDQIVVDMNEELGNAGLMMDDLPKTWEPASDRWGLRLGRCLAALAKERDELNERLRLMALDRSRVERAYLDEHRATETMRQERDEWKARAEKAEAACAAMLDALRANGVENERTVGETGRAFGFCIGRCPAIGHLQECELARAALTSDAGRDYLHLDKVREVVKTFAQTLDSDMHPSLTIDEESTLNVIIEEVCRGK